MRSAQARGGRGTPAAASGAPRGRMKLLGLDIASSSFASARRTPAGVERQEGSENSKASGSRFAADRSRQTYRSTLKPVSQESGADSNAVWGNPAMTAFSGAARIRVTVLLGGILDLGICLTSD